MVPEAFTPARVTEAESEPSWVERHYVMLALAVLALALFNLTFRLSREFVAEWDESLYRDERLGSERARLVDGATTFLGAVDYYNTKPPLLIWLIALMFKAFGPGLVSLRVVSAISAWLTVAVLQLWTKRVYGAAVALLSSLALATTFGFVHVHSGRSAATDAPFTLVIVLIVITLWAERDRPSQRLWLGPLLAAAFMFRGMAVLMPMTLIATVWLARTSGTKSTWRFTAAALALFLLPILMWSVARHRIDGWQFFQRLFMYDFVARSVSPIEGHPGGPLFYLNVLQKNQFDWLLAGALGFLLFPMAWRDVRARVRSAFRQNDNALLLTAWAVVTLTIPSLMATKVPWYLNTFFPVFSVAVALSVVRGLTLAREVPVRRWRGPALAAVLAVVVVAAESRLLWYSFHQRDLRLSEQALVLRARSRLRGHRVYLARQSGATRFVTEAVVGARAEAILDPAIFFQESQTGDYLLRNGPCDTQMTDLVGTNGTHYLCVRR